MRQILESSFTNIFLIIFFSLMTLVFWTIRVLDYSLSIYISIPDKSNNYKTDSETFLTLPTL